MKRLLLPRILLAATAACLLLADGLAQEKPAPADRSEELPPDLLTIVRNSRPSFLVRVSVDKPSATYREGENLAIRVACEEDAYIYVMYQPSAGKNYQIFPNKLQTNNLVKARQAVAVPAGDDFFRWVVSEPFGEEKIKVIATKKKIEALSSPELMKGRFNRLDDGVLKGMELEIGDEPPTAWAEDDCVVYTYAAGDKSPELARSRRFGVFFGVSKHFFAPFIRAAKKIAPNDEALGKMPDTGYDLFACHRDAQKLATAMQENGQLEEARVLTNDRATRAAMEEALTQWLPSVSRPGDTVFIYFSGHTGQFDDKSGDERDGKDEYLVTHDSFGSNEVYAAKKVLENREQALASGLLNENELRACEQLSAVGDAVREATGDYGELIEKTGVTDDLMAHWLQRLAGRQVIFICDSCNSAGFAEREQDATSAANDMMKNELARLQNLGQADQALFCSAHVGQSAQERIDKSMGVMTYYIVELMNSSPKAVKMEETFEYCQANVEKYYAEWNAEIEKAKAAGVLPADTGKVGAAPFLFNNCRLPIYFKP